jgi:hypothetical protein
MAETPRYAHLVTLLFLGSGLVIFVCMAVAGVAAIAKAGRVAKFAAGGAAFMILSYCVLLFGVALASRDRTLAPGERKYFCEADCHIAYSIEGTQEASTLGAEAKPITAQGRFVVVRLKTWFDQNSIAPWRGNAPLTPEARTVQVVDDRGRRFLPLPLAAAAVYATSTSMTEPLRPGESYSTTFVFDLPMDARNPRLLIRDVEPVSRLLVDHENSVLHGKIYLALSPTASTTASAVH